MVVALVIRAALLNLLMNTVIRAQALAAAQILSTTAGAGTMDLMLLYANHGVMILADTVLSQPWVQAQCKHFQVIIVESRGTHYITYYRRTKLVEGQAEEDGRLWLQRLRAKRPLVDPKRRKELGRTTRSAGQPPQNLDTYIPTQITSN
jgi:hypothetical protein